MTAEVISNAYAQFGVLGAVVVAFFVLVWWVLKTCTAREEKLYKIISTLSEELPEIRTSLENIENTLYNRTRDRR